MNQTEAVESGVEKVTMESILRRYAGKEWDSQLRALLRRDLISWEQTSAGFPSERSYFKLKHEAVTGYVSVSRQTPMWRHDCADCQYLGRWGVFDLYYHRRTNGGGLLKEEAVRARFDDGVADYYEGGVMRGEDRHPALHIARSRRWDQDDPVEVTEDFADQHPARPEDDTTATLAEQLREACAFRGKLFTIAAGEVTDAPWVVREVLEGTGLTKQLGAGATLHDAVAAALRAVGA
jgi:hypothetical protein